MYVKYRLWAIESNARSFFLLERWLGDTIQVFRRLACDTARVIQESQENDDIYLD